MRTEKLKLWKVLEGDVRDQLKKIRSNVVHTVVTSPPYYGLRNYETDPKIWGGKHDCNHVWGDDLSPHHKGQVEQTKWKNAKAAGHGQNISTGNFCVRCWAWLGHLGLEPTLELYISNIVTVFQDVWRVLRDDGTVWLNLGDSYAGSGRGAWNRTDVQKEVYVPKPNGPEARIGKQKQNGLKPKDLIGVPWRVAFSLQAAGWYLRSAIVWHKPNCMPDSVQDRPTLDYETVFLLTKQARYFYDAHAIKERAAVRPTTGTRVRNVGGRTDGYTITRGGVVGTPSDGRNRRAVWTIATEPTPEAHFATYPRKLVEPCIMAGTSAKGACRICGAPWRRNVEKTKQRVGVSQGGNYHGEKRDDGTKVMQGGYQPGTRYEEIDHGWQPGCAHEAPPRPCVVLDPFHGAGTTGIVANGLGRAYIGIELNPEYVRISEARRRKFLGY